MLNTGLGIGTPVVHRTPARETRHIRTTYAGKHALALGADLTAANFKPPWTAVLITLDPADISGGLAKLASARTAGLACYVFLSGEECSLFKTANRFDLSLWQGLVDDWVGQGLESYITDGTIAGHGVIDEPHNWCPGSTVSVSDCEAAASFSLGLWPTMPCGIRSLGSYVNSGTWVNNSFILDMYKFGRDPVPSTHVPAEKAICDAKGLTLFMNISVSYGGAGGGQITATELSQLGQVALTTDGCAGLMLHHYSNAWRTQVDVNSTLNDLHNLAISKRSVTS